MATQRDSIDDGMLIELYREERSLWDTTNVNYFNRDRKRESMMNIASKMGLSDDAVRKKINSFRTIYTRHLGKIKSLKAKLGASANVVYEPKWKWYAVLDAFLQPHVTVRKYGINMDPDVNETASDMHGLAPNIDYLLDPAGPGRPDELSCSSPRSSSPSQKEGRMSESDTKGDMLILTAKCPAPVQSTSCTPGASLLFPQTSTFPQTSSSHHRQMSPSPPMSSSRPRSCKRKRSRSPSTSDILRYVEQVIQGRREERAERMRLAEQMTQAKENEENEYFVRYIKGELNKLSPQKQLAAKFQISKVIYDVNTST